MEEKELSEDTKKKVRLAAVAAVHVYQGIYRRQLRSNRRQNRTKWEKFIDWFENSILFIIFGLIVAIVVSLIGFSLMEKNCGTEIPFTGTVLEKQHELRKGEIHVGSGIGSNGKSIVPVTTVSASNDVNSYYVTFKTINGIYTATCSAKTYWKLKVNDTVKGVHLHGFFTNGYYESTIP